MPKYRCLVLDHDDTVVQSEATINYPYFCYILDQFRPGQKITWTEYIRGCCDLGFSEMCRRNYQFTEQELVDEYLGWKDFIRSHIPAPYVGMKEIILRQKAEGGILCVVSHSNEEIIRRDYQAHFGIQLDDIYGWDYPEHQRKPNPYPLESIMQKYNLAPADLIVVDDMRPAWEMASKVGVKTALAAWSKADIPEIVEELTKLYDYSFSSPENLEKFLFD